MYVAGGLNQRHMSAKSVRHIFNDSTLYCIYKEYLNAIKADEDDENQPFYRRPISGLKFSKQCIGVNKLSTLMKTMCSEAGLKGNYTNHSGKRTCATRLYQAGVEEQEIMSITGHRSINSVRQYKRPSENMLKDISNILEPQLDTAKRIKSETCTNVSGVDNGACFNTCVFNINYN